MQLKPKASPLNVCIDEEVKTNVIDINQIQPIQSKLVKKSSSCSSSDANNLNPNAVPENPNTSEAPNTVITLPNENNNDVSEIIPTPVPETVSPERPESISTEITSPSTTSPNVSESGFNDDDDSHS